MRMRTILRLAIGRIRTKKAHSAVICTAILLTLTLFMTVVSIAVNLVSSYGMMLRLASGTDYHGYLRGATFLADGETIRDTAKLNPEIADAVISSNAGQCALRPEDLHTSELTLRLIERGADLQHFYTDITAGRFPESDAEILLNPLYFPDIRIGVTLGFYYTGYADGVVGCAYAECTVSGFIEGRTDAQLRMVMRYSDTLSETYGFSEQYLNVYFSFNDTKSMTQKADALVQNTLAAYVDPAYDVHCVLNQAYLQPSFREALNPATVFLILFSLFIVFLCSFLLICNIYSIALTQDMQTFGLLHVIGTTHRQLHGMIVIQSVLLFTVSLPLGLVLGYGIGWKLLSPLLVSAIAAEGLQFRFHLWIPLAAAGITVFLGFPAIVFLIRTSMHALVSLQWQAGVLVLAVCIYRHIHPVMYRDCRSDEKRHASGANAGRIGKRTVGIP